MNNDDDNDDDDEGGCLLVRVQEQRGSVAGRRTDVQGREGDQMDGLQGEIIDKELQYARRMYGLNACMYLRKACGVRRKAQRSSLSWRGRAAALDTLPRRRSTWGHGRIEQQAGRQAGHLPWSHPRPASPARQGVAKTTGSHQKQDTGVGQGRTASFVSSRGGEQKQEERPDRGPSPGPGGGTFGRTQGERSARSDAMAPCWPLPCPLCLNTENSRTGWMGGKGVGKNPKKREKEEEKSRLRECMRVWEAGRERVTWGRDDGIRCVFPMRPGAGFLSQPSQTN